MLRVWRKVSESDARNVVPNSARIGYATERALALYLRAAVYRRCRRPLKGLGSNKTVEATQRTGPSTYVNIRRIHVGYKKKKSSVSIQTILVLFELA